MRSLSNDYSSTHLQYLTEGESGSVIFAGISGINKVIHSVISVSTRLIILVYGNNTNSYLTMAE